MISKVAKYLGIYYLDVIGAFELSSHVLCKNIYSIEALHSKDRPFANSVSKPKAQPMILGPFLVILLPAT